MLGQPFDFKRDEPSALLDRNSSNTTLPQLEQYVLAFAANPRIVFVISKRTFGCLHFGHRRPPNDFFKSRILYHEIEGIISVIDLFKARYVCKLLISLFIYPDSLSIFVQNRTFSKLNIFGSQLPFSQSIRYVNLLYKISIFLLVLFSKKKFLFIIGPHQNLLFHR